MLTRARPECPREHANRHHVLEARRGDGRLQRRRAVRVVQERAQRRRRRRRLVRQGVHPLHTPHSLHLRHLHLRHLRLHHLRLNTAISPLRSRRTTATARSTRATRSRSASRGPSTRPSALRRASTSKTRPIWPTKRGSKGLIGRGWPKPGAALGLESLRVPPGGESGRAERHLVFNIGAPRRRRRQNRLVHRAAARDGARVGRAPPRRGSHPLDLLQQIRSCAIPLSVPLPRYRCSRASTPTTHVHAGRQVHVHPSRDWRPRVRPRHARQARDHHRIRVRLPP